MRRIEFRDLIHFWNWRNANFKYFRQQFLLSKPDQIRWYNSLKGDKTRDFYVIDHIDENKLKIPASCFGLTSINYINRNAEFSIIVNPLFEKQGYGEQSLSALFSIGFYQHGLNLIYGEVLEGNPALFLFKKMGMLVEGNLRDRYFKSGQFIYSTMVSLKKYEFENYLRREGASSDSD